MSVVAELLPDYQQRTQHCATAAAAPHALVAAAREITVEEVRGMRLLLGVRALPVVVRGRSPVPVGGMVDLGLRHGFTILADEPSELVIGYVGQPWRLAGGEVVPAESGAGFVAFDRPGFVKVAADFRASPAVGGSELCTETRVAATDEETARRFARYWAVISPFGGWLRRQMLAAVARRVAHSGK